MVVSLEAVGALWSIEVHTRQGIAYQILAIPGETKTTTAWAGTGTVDPAAHC